ncbi:MAG TPA: N-acyl homoserine lactonase family protein [Phenylobacterium sp.]|nr:N-acyl homoserine lactonase family protein [Phenylobacterium sp.]
MSQTPEILPLRCGTIRVPAHYLETNSAGDLVLPVYAYLITHPSGRLALFDAGLARSDDGKTLVDAFYNELPEGHDVAARVTAAGVEPGRIEILVASHCHYDHVGGADLIPNARLLVHREEEVRNLDAGHDLARIEDGHDLFGDGSVEVFATPGHTCGHQSLRVRRQGGSDILAGDACYFCRSLDRDDVDQPHPFDKGQYLASKRRLIQMRAEGDFVIPGHDEGFLDNIPKDSAVRVSPLSRL